MIFPCYKLVSTVIVLITKHTVRLNPMGPGSPLYSTCIADRSFVHRANIACLISGHSENRVRRGVRAFIEDLLYLSYI